MSAKHLATKPQGKKLQVHVKRKMEVRKQTPVKDKVVVAKAMVETNLNDVDYSGPAGPRLFLFFFAIVTSYALWIIVFAVNCFI